ncbi:MAG: hypothetical protein ABI772_13075 [Bacteroidota bacterium]
MKTFHITSNHQKTVKEFGSLFSILNKYFISLLCCFSFTVSQSKDYLEVPVKLNVQSGSTDGVTVSVIRNGIPTATLDGKRNMNLLLEYNRKYTLLFKKLNYISKSVEFDTHVSAARIKDGIEPYTIGVKLFSQDDKEHQVVYNQAVGQIRFDKNLDEFTYDTDYSKSILSDMDEDNESADATEDDNTTPSAGSAPVANNSLMPDIKSPEIIAAGNTLTSSSAFVADAERIQSQKSTTLTGLSASDVNVDDHLFNNISINREIINEKTRVITITTITKGEVISEYRKVVYNWGGTFFFKDAVHSISENIYTLNTK